LFVLKNKWTEQNYIGEGCPIWKLGQKSQCGT
jgi:hypothetical protein